MFYYIVNKITADNENKTRNVIIIGSMCYIILHGFLYAKANENNAIIQKIKQYMHYVIGADMAMTGLHIYMKPSISKQKVITPDKPKFADMHKKLLEYKQANSPPVSAPVSGTSDVSAPAKDPAKVQVSESASEPAKESAKEPVSKPANEPAIEDTEIPAYGDD
jgi:hypothetical protein